MTDFNSSYYRIPAMKSYFIHLAVKCIHFIITKLISNSQTNIKTHFILEYTWFLSRFSMAAIIVRFTKVWIPNAVVWLSRNRSIYHLDIMSIKNPRTSGLMILARIPRYWNAQRLWIPVAWQYLRWWNREKISTELSYSYWITSKNFPCEHSQLSCFT